MPADIPMLLLAAALVFFVGAALARVNLPNRAPSTWLFGVAVLAFGGFLMCLLCEPSVMGGVQ